MRVLIDSSIWIEFFAGGRGAKDAEKYFKPPHKVVLPSVVAYEVYKKIKSAKGEQTAVLMLAQMERLSNSIVPIDQGLAVKAADLSLQHSIPMADAMIYAAALSSGAAIVTMDAHFKDLPNVFFIS